jgi:hypothetical protein
LGDQWVGVLVGVGSAQSVVQGGAAGAGCASRAQFGPGSLGDWSAVTGGCAGAGCALGERRRIVVWSVAGGAGTAPAGGAVAGGAVASLAAGPGAVGVGMAAGCGVAGTGVGRSVGVGVTGLAAGVAGLRGAGG